MTSYLLLCIEAAEDSLQTAAYRVFSPVQSHRGLHEDLESLKYHLQSRALQGQCSPSSVECAVQRQPGV